MCLSLWYTIFSGYTWGIVCVYSLEIFAQVNAKILCKKRLPLRGRLCGTAGGFAVGLNTHMRKNYKLYDANYILDPHVVEQLDQCVARAPTQLCKDSNRYSVIKSSSIDLTRHTLAPLIFGNTRMSVVEAAPLTSSLVYYFAMHLNDPSPWHPTLHLGLISGMLVSRALELGVDASFIACRWDTIDHRRVNTVLHQNYNIPRKVNLSIQLAVCVGRGLEPDPGQYDLELLTGQTVPYIPSINQVGPRPTHYLDDQS